MSFSAHKNAVPSHSTSTKSLRTLSSTSEESVFEPKKDRNPSFPTLESIRQLNLKRGSILENPPPRRRVSVQYPVTDYASKWRRAVKSENNITNIIGYKPLTLSRSQENLNSKRRRSSAWRVLSLVCSAKSKLTGDISPPPNHRKLSFSDILRLVHVSPSDIQRRRMVRLLKQKALQTKIKMYKCCFCAQTLRSLSSLRQHEGRHRKEAPYKCEECDLVFFSKANFQRHQLSHNQERRFVCSNCDASFLTDKDLRRHRRRKARELPYTCDICNIKVEDMGKLLDHMSVHTGEKKHICDICNKRFGFLSSLSRHRRIH